MSPSQPKIVLKFEIKSLDPSHPTIESVPAAEALASDLEGIVSVRFPGAKVTIRRAEGIPGLREVQELLLQVDWHAVKTGAETAAGSFAAAEFLKLIKERLRNLFVKPVSAGQKGKGKSEQRKKKASKSTKSSQAKKKSRSTRTKRK